MTPNRRLDQLEPLVADGLQKIDRLVEGQGQLLEVATRAEQKADIAAKKADTTAKAVANLTIKVNQIANQQAEFQDEVKREFQQVNQKFDLIIDLLRKQ
jgi:formate-dependent nitrite reductase cytochrome c552 subunit